MKADKLNDVEILQSLGGVSKLVSNSDGKSKNFIETWKKSDYKEDGGNKECNTCDKNINNNNNESRSKRENDEIKINEKQRNNNKEIMNFFNKRKKEKKYVVKNHILERNKSRENSENDIDKDNTYKEPINISVNRLKNKPNFEEIKSFNQTKQGLDKEINNIDLGDFEFDKFSEINPGKNKAQNNDKSDLKEAKEIQLKQGEIIFEDLCNVRYSDEEEEDKGDEIKNSNPLSLTNQVKIALKDAEDSENEAEMIPETASVEKMNGINTESINKKMNFFSESNMHISFKKQQNGPNIERESISEGDEVNEKNKERMDIFSESDIKEANFNGKDSNENVNILLKEEEDDDVKNQKNKEMIRQLKEEGYKIEGNTDEEDGNDT